MTHPVFSKNSVAGGTIAERRFVKFHTTAGQVVQASAATDLVIGVCGQPGGVVAGARADIHLAGMVDVDAGGTIAAGALVTSDASGKAVTAAPATGVNNRIAGYAYEAAVSGDIFRVMLAPGMMQGA